VAFVALVDQLRRWRIDLIDCQVHTEHMSRFGAEEWPRARFLRALADALEHPTRTGPWRFDSAPAPANEREPPAAEKKTGPGGGPSS
jgi:leucyl/phenylalanyl-tRNA--protein transferase